MGWLCIPTTDWSRPAIPPGVFPLPPPARSAVARQCARLPLPMKLVPFLHRLLVGAARIQSFCVDLILGVAVDNARNSIATGALAVFKSPRRFFLCFRDVPSRHIEPTEPCGEHRREIAAVHCASGRHEPQDRPGTRASKCQARARWRHTPGCRSCRRLPLLSDPQEPPPTQRWWNASPLWDSRPMLAPTASLNQIFGRLADDEEASSRLGGAFGISLSTALFEPRLILAVAPHLQVVAFTAAQRFLSNAAFGILSLHMTSTQPAYP